MKSCSITDSRKRIQKWIQKRAAVVVSCSDCCFLFRKRAREGGCQGAPGHGHSPLFQSGGHPFFEQVFGALFFTQNHDFWWKLLPKWIQNEVCWVLFFEHFWYFLVKKGGSEICPFFLWFFGYPECSKGWAHMQSVHACAVQTHFSVFVLFLKRGSQKTLK